MTEEAGKQIEAEYRELRREILEKRDAELERLRQEKESKKRVRRERRALLWAAQHSDGEYVRIPISIVQMILEDLEALNTIRKAVNKLER